MVELDGVTSFRSLPNTTFRFKVSVTKDKMNVWLEDRKSKKQWQSDYLAQDAFVTSDNAIPGAKLVEYANCFKRALEKTEGNEVDPIERELRADKNNGFRLEFVVHIKVFESLWSPTYSLALKSIAIDRIDILESRLFDAEQEAARCSKLKAPSVLTELTASNATSSGSRPVWSTKSGSWFVAGRDGNVRARADGTYMVALQAQYHVTTHGAAIVLVKGSERVLLETILHDPDSCNNYDYYGNRSRSSSGFAATSALLELKEGSSFAVEACGFRMEAGAKMVIAKLSGC